MGTHSAASLGGANIENHIMWNTDFFMNSSLMSNDTVHHLYITCVFSDLNTKFSSLIKYMNWVERS